MCLVTSESVTLKAKKFRKGTVIRYKVLDKLATELNKDGFVLNSMWHNKKWEPGWIKSDRKRTKTTKVPLEINRGIHVYVDRKRAKASLGYNETVLAVRCHIDDLIGISPGKTEEAYYKVFVTETAYKNAIKGGR